MFRIRELVKKVFLTSSQTRPVSLGSRLKGLRLAASHEGHALRTFASRAVFSPTYTPPEKMIPIFFALAGANSARLFIQTEETLTISFAFSWEGFSTDCGGAAVNSSPTRNIGTLGTEARLTGAARVP